MKSEIYNKQDKKCNIQLEQNLKPRKTSAILSITEKMAETRAWKELRGLTENSQCRLCKEQRQPVQYIFAGCKMLASSEYLARHNRALMVIAVTQAKEQNLLDQNVKWYQEKWKRRHVLQKSQAKLVWDFQFILWKTTTSRRPDLMLEEKQTKTIWICDMTCPQENNIERRDWKIEPIIGSLHSKQEREDLDSKLKLCCY